MAGACTMFYTEVVKYGAEKQRKVYNYKKTLQ